MHRHPVLKHMGCVAEFRHPHGTGRISQDHFEGDVAIFDDDGVGLRRAGCEALDGATGIERGCERWNEEGFVGGDGGGDGGVLKL